MITQEQEEFLIANPQLDPNRHGGCFDRGLADSYYGRPRNPHYYVGATYMSDVVTVENMSAEEIAAYNAGYDNNDRKAWD